MKARDLLKVIQEAGFTAKYHDEKLILEPSHLKLVHIKIELTKKRMYISDPRLVPPELQEKNILTIDQPPVVTAILQSGEEIPIFFTNPESQVTITQNTVGPDEM